MRKQIAAVLPPPVKKAVRGILDRMGLGPKQAIDDYIVKYIGQESSSPMTHENPLLLSIHQHLAR